MSITLKKTALLLIVLSILGTSIYAVADRTQDPDSMIYIEKEPKLIPLSHQNQLITAGLSESIKLLELKGKVLMINEDKFGICGNDEMFSDKAIAQEKRKTRLAQLKQPYIFDKDFFTQPKLNVENVEFIQGVNNYIGTTKIERLETDYEKYDQPLKSKNFNQLIRLKFNINNGETVTATLTQSKPVSIAYEIIFTLKNNVWEMQSLKNTTPQIFNEAERFKDY